MRTRAHTHTHTHTLITNLALPTLASDASYTGITRAAITTTFTAADFRLYPLLSHSTF